MYFLALLYLFSKLKDEDKTKKSLFLIYPVIVFIVIWNPIFAKIILKFIDFDVYWRMYWLLPLGITLAYVFTDFIFSNSKMLKRICSAIAVIVIIMASGKLVYTEEFFKKVNNPYKIPDDVLGIIQMVSEDNEETKKLIGPEEFIIYTRQYDGTISLGEVRDFTSQYEYPNMVNLINSGNITELVKRAENSKCNYIVMPKTVLNYQELEDYEYTVLGENETYVVYKY